jgi:perosamine synthetase
MYARSPLSRKVKMLTHGTFKTVKGWIQGQPLTTPPLISGTLDRDDVMLARKLLKDENNWIDPAKEMQYASHFAEWNGSKYAFPFMGGRAALSACIYALDLRPDDEVIVPGYTCVAVPNAFIFANIKPTYSDIELDTYGLDASLIKQVITPKTKAILLHHLYGLVCRDYEKLIALAQKHNLYIIEDCAQSAGAMFKNKKVGNLGDVAFYSSEQSKIFNTIQGGLVVTNNEVYATRLKEYYDKAPYPSNERISKQLFNVIIHYYTYKHPLRWCLSKLYSLLYYEKIYESTTEEEIRGIKPNDYGFKMPAALAIIGFNQLQKIDKYNQMRRENAQQWSTWCDTHGYKKPVVISNSNPVYLRYPVMVEPEKKLDTLWASKELGIELGVWFVSNVHPSERIVVGCPKADKAVRRCVNFPTLTSGSHI